MKLALFFIAALAFGQEPSKQEPPKPTFEQLQKQAEADKQEIARLTALLNWYTQQYFVLQARMIEQQVAPKPEAKPKPAPNGETR